MISDHDEAIKQIKYAYDQGINVSRAKHIPENYHAPLCNLPLYSQSHTKRLFINCFIGCRQAFDTANTYSKGESEVILGKALKQHKIPRESVVILTKTYNTDGNVEDKGPAGFVNQRGLSRKVKSTIFGHFEGANVC